jgi:chemotaxis-related protein WspD
MTSGCWETIGVHGDSSCEELAQHIHCRNCPVYSTAARGLLDRAIPEEEIAAATARVAAPPRGGDGMRHALLVFRVGREWLALPMSVVREIAERRPVHSVPHRRDGAVLGVANIRGELLVCVSLAHVLGIDRTSLPADARSRFVVLRRGEARAVCPADEVHGVLRVDPGDLRSVPATIAQAPTHHSVSLFSWQDRSVGVLDDAALFRTLQRSLS